MDSKLMRFCIIGSMLGILLVLLLVLYTNTEHGMGNGSVAVSTGEELPKEPDTNTTEQLGIRTDKGLQIGYALDAFEKDADFFDNFQDNEKPDLKKQLSMVINSVEKDLRIRIVDGYGNTILNEEFVVSVDGKAEYKDLDHDGQIHITGMDSGEYKVALMPIKDYEVPAEMLKVSVKDKVEYVAIRDISLLIKTEADIDAMEEDANIRNATEDADKTEITKLQKKKEGTCVGIDVSKWNQEIDWDKVKAAGVEFAIIRAGYRGTKTGALVVDPYFEQNMRGATDAKIEKGVYFFSQAINEVEAVEEASMVVKLLKEYEVQYPVFIDTESVGGTGRADQLDTETRTRVCEAFCRTIENEGYEAGVYACRNWYHKHLDTKRLEQYFIWLAEYRKTPLYQGSYQMWQYTSKGKVDGIEGNVDMNVRYLK